MTVAAVLWVHSCPRCQFATVNTDSEACCPFCGQDTITRVARP